MLRPLWMITTRPRHERPYGDLDCLLAAAGYRVCLPHVGDHPAAGHPDWTRHATRQRQSADQRPSAEAREFAMGETDVIVRGPVTGRFGFRLELGRDGSGVRRQARRGGCHRAGGSGRVLAALSRAGRAADSGAADGHDPGCTRGLAVRAGAGAAAQHCLQLSMAAQPELPASGPAACLAAQRPDHGAGLPRLGGDRLLPPDATHVGPGAGQGVRRADRKDTGRAQAPRQR
jgi:hypothetical protein